MTLTLDFDTLCSAITTRARTISGIRKAYDYDEWPDSPPGMYRAGEALHLTGFPDEGLGGRYILRGSDLSEWEVELPLYTVVLTSAKLRRSRNWMAPFPERYRAAFDTRTAITDVGTGNTGSILYAGFSIVRGVVNWPGYDEVAAIRHVLSAHLKGPVSRD